jgi:uncharacterized protein (TIGR03435 family)
METFWMNHLDRILQAITGSILVLVTCFVAVGAAPGQATKDGSGNGTNLQEFEVATIKPHPPGDAIISMQEPPGRYEAKNVTAKLLIEQAFEVPEDQVSGGPSWMESQRFDVSAKISEAQWEEIKDLDYSHRHQAITLTLQSLLKDRFQLAISNKPKELTVYALVQAKGGAKLRAAGAPEPPKAPDSGNRLFLMGMSQKDIPVTVLASFLSTHYGRTVLDRTGLTRKYDITLEVGQPTDNSPDEADSAISYALEDQLGLKLVSRKEVVDTIAIDRLEQPSAN